MIATAVPQHLPGVLHTLEPTLNHLGYLAVVGLVLIEDFGVPVPGETVLILAAVYAATGRLNVVLVGLLGFCGAVIGDNIGFAIGHFGGRPLIQRYGRYIFLTRERVDRASGFLDRHGGWIIIIARFIEGLRQANGIIAGISGIHWAKFLAFNAIGAALWVTVWTSIGYLSGSHINTIYNDATRYSTYVAAAVVALLVAYIARHMVRARRARARTRPETRRHRLTPRVRHVAPTTRSVHPGVGPGCHRRDGHIKRALCVESPPNRHLCVKGDSHELII
jgi:membrane protein DedA with SNARE-associated domain